MRSLLARGQACPHCDSPLTRDYVAPRPEARRPPIRVFVCDDDPSIRALVCRQLQARGEFELAGSAGESNSAIEGIAAARPDVVLLDHFVEGLGEESGVQRVRARSPGVRVVVYSALPPSAQHGGASRPDGYVHKDAPLEELYQVIAEVTEPEAG